MGMWWEIVPVFALCTGLAWLPVWLISGTQKAVYGTQYGRNLQSFHHWGLYQRDRDHAPPSLLSTSRRFYNKNTGVGEGFVYKTYGLEAYADEK